MHIYTLLKFSRSSFSFLLPQRASLKRDSRPNLYVCMYIYIYCRWNLDRFGVFRPTTVHCFRVGRLYSCLINRHKANRQCDYYTRCFSHALYAVLSQLYTQWFEHYTRCFQHYFYIFFPCIWFHDCLNLVCDYSAFWLWSAMTMTCFKKVYL
jgi:hypothetical protein